ncbi:hypothetical protein P175DRAFT_0521055 [Aspergillus ochraceoroseus IBT 24754]|uniref:Putative zinc-finger domain-containing protein n=1 Tax=Aspergillus ochraceoroseus IBT 24754 TaxID=1392256 RepID=A0A2T5M9P7_9EURO|nr:uncharacterized protein P175DRAFT_0521055 [Aspergillus ochraceoroseus IBT 24754]PTU25258.1 hypothetical protein P175DRAFT_0521055 [Aspergillus ochraceoroseus IBT 24754]
MSNHQVPPVPPYWGPSNYTQPWAPHPSSSGPVPQGLPFNQGPTLPVPPPLQNLGSHALDYTNNLEGFYANAGLPGLGGPGATASLPPPPFPFAGAFPPGQLPPPPFPPHMPNIAYPMVPVPPLPHAQPSRPSTTEQTQTVQPDAPESRPMTTSSSEQDLDREEGELTDMEPPVTKSGPRPRHTGDTYAKQESRIPPKQGHYNQTKDARYQGSRSSGARPSHLSSIALAPKASSATSDLEEGEASPEPHTSRRDSGSPYNPPLPMDIESPSAAKSAPAPSIEQFNDVNNPVLASAQLHTGKSLAQLRVQAQGALLGLAPHSIRYSELVGEGINPLILKQLYEEVGIKVPSSPPSASQVSPKDFYRPGAKEPEEQEAQQIQPTESKTRSSQKTIPTDSTLTAVQSTQSTSSKPMERKEVIARMLAAKAAAAKTSSVSAPSQTDTAITAPAPESLVPSTDKSLASTPSEDISKEKEVRVKEKNKAQTELARQRIEQLKKQGLMRSQQKSQTEAVSPEKEQLLATSSQASSSMAIQHPLPVRPPDPEAVSLARIPGLFMNEQSAANDSTNAPAQSLGADSTSQSRASQRKRPRASDFDEPIPVPKRNFSNGTNHVPLPRLVIDISDDEFYGDDEDGSMDIDLTAESTLQSSGEMEGTESLQPVLPSSIESLPHRPATSQSLGYSVSSTPQINRNGEQDDLRKKHLEIQAMHRRIAELEQRKKARLASRTQSPRNSDLSPPENSTPVDSEAVNPSLVVETVALEPSNKPGDEFLSSLGVETLHEMKSKLQRKDEIEAGVPSLDAEIQKSEAKLADFKKEGDKLLLEITKGKEGRQQLLQELSSLKAELNGLSLEEVITALTRSELKTETLNHIPEVPGHQDDTSPEDKVSVQEPPQDQSQILDTAPTQDSSSHAQELDEPQSVAPNNMGIPAAPAVPADELADELPDASMSEDSRSSMDESTGSSSSSSDSSDEEMPDEEVHDAGSVAAESLGGSLNISPDNQDELNADNMQQVPEVQQSEIQPQSDMTCTAEENDVAMEDQSCGESSVSEAYEPPEPEESSAAGSTYSPPLSPVSPGSLAPEETPKSREDQSKEAGEPLTGKVQELDFQQPSHYPRVGLLDNERQPEDSERKFSPYHSPLKLFKGYRYHPNYTDTVSGGYRSLTYSHNIDPMKYLCPFEAAGGVCNDKFCEFQHFRDMALSDDKVLVQMGSRREGKTPEESDSYLAGLKQMINDMRREKVKDFSTVAAEIAAYRRRFLQDPSRVLAL